MIGLFRRKGSSQESQDAGELPTDTPEEVRELMRNRESFNEPDLQINILSEAASAKYTGAMRSMSVGNELGLVVLDDANDSNPYCYVANGPAAGMVVHFNHDPEPKIEFLNLKAFQDFLIELRNRSEPIWSAEIPSPAHPNQELLVRSLTELAESPPDDDVQFLICLYLPLLRGERVELLSQLSRSEDFFVREAVADHIGAFQFSGSEALVLDLANDAHPQVRSAAMRAIKAMRQVPSGEA
jgi:hypothetical protein